MQQPYAVIDKKNATLSVYQGDRLLEQHAVTTGENQGDGYVPGNGRYYSQLPKLTGAGVFTLGHITQGSPYLGHEPMAMLFAGN